MAEQIKIKGFGGTLKAISASNLYAQMDSSAAWYSSDASSVSVDDVLSNANRDWIIMEAGQYVEVEFTADTGGRDGQGLIIPEFFENCEVEDLTNTVKTLGVKFLTYGSSRTDAYSSGNATTVSADQLIPVGSYLVCEKTGIFHIKLTLPNKTSPYVMVPLVTLFFAVP